VFQSGKGLITIDFFVSPTFTWIIGILGVLTILGILITTFQEYWGDTDVWGGLLKVILFIPMVVVGAILLVIEKRYWGVAVLAIVLIIMFAIAFLYDPGEGPVPWNS
jgi:hypothetical protein